MCVTFVLTEDDVNENIRHYRRRAYLRMAEEIRGASATDLVVEPESGLSRAYRQRPGVRGPAADRGQEGVEATAGTARYATGSPPPVSPSGPECHLPLPQQTLAGSPLNGPPGRGF